MALITAAAFFGRPAAPELIPRSLRPAFKS
jgi:hypothetical protein